MMLNTNTNWNTNGTRLLKRNAETRLLEHDCWNTTAETRLMETTTAETRLLENEC
jgi:hypothetical protein